MKVIRGTSNRRTVLVCAACLKVFQTYLPKAQEHGPPATPHARVGVCPICRARIREWIHTELAEGRKLETT